MKIKRPYSLDRIARFSLVLNFAEIAVLAAISAVLLEPHFSLQNALLRPVAIISCFMLMINNIINIRIGRHWTDADAQYDMVKDALGHVERLNVELRTQRHDFMNHLQVVYSLVEMDDCPSATEYIDKILGNMRNTSLSSRTAKPAVNALLLAKLSDCASRGIQMSVNILSNWSALPIEEWEMCRVLGNLIDNAMDALAHTTDAQIDVELTENLSEYSFAITNNGPIIPANLISRIWARGFSTNGAERGMGLHIVKTILEENGGRIDVDSTPERTVFSGYIPFAR